MDSTNYEFKKQMKRAHLFISEKNSEYTYTKNKGNRETVHATRTSGLKQPIYELLAIQLQSFSFTKTNIPSLERTTSALLETELLKSITIEF